MAWSPENITAIIVAIIMGGLGALIAALFAGRKTRAEARTGEANAANSYEQLSARMETRYTALLAQFDKAQEEIQKLRKDVDGLCDQVHDKDTRIEELTQENVKLTDKVTQLTRRVKELEKQLPPTS